MLGELMTSLVTDIKSTMMMIFGVIILFVLCWVAGVVIKLGTKLLKKIGIEIDVAQLNSAQGIAAQVVSFMNQKVVDGLKAASSDGKLTDEQKTDVYNQAYNMTTSFLTSDQISSIIAKYGSLETGIKIMIETQVNSNKKDIIVEADPATLSITDTEADFVIDTLNEQLADLASTSSIEETAVEVDSNETIIDNAEVPATEDEGAGDTDVEITETVSEGE